MWKPPPSLSPAGLSARSLATAGGPLAPPTTYRPSCIHTRCFTGNKKRDVRGSYESKSKERWEGISQLNKFAQFVYNPHYFSPRGRSCTHKHWLILDWADKLGAGAHTRMLQKLLKCKKKYHRGSERRGMRMKKARVRVSEVTHTRAHMLSLSHTHTQHTRAFTPTRAPTNPLQTKPPQAHLGRQSCWPSGTHLQERWPD